MMTPNLPVWVLTSCLAGIAGGLALRNHTDRVRTTENCSGCQAVVEPTTNPTGFQASWTLLLHQNGLCGCSGDCKASAEPKCQHYVSLTIEATTGYVVWSGTCHVDNDPATPDQSSVETLTMGGEGCGSADSKTFRWWSHQNSCTGHTLVGPDSSWTATFGCSDCKGEC